MSDMANVKVSRVVAGSKAIFESRSRFTRVKRSRAVATKSIARGVGSIPRDVLTNSGSPSAKRSRANAELAAGWLMPRFLAATVTLPASKTDTATRSRFRSNGAIRHYHVIE